jgi:hypothetical protein
MAQYNETCGHTETISRSSILPALAGSVKQIDWATSIRAEKLTDAEAAGAKIISQMTAHFEAGKPSICTMEEGRAMVEQALGALFSQTAAGWWIDRRTASGSELFSVHFVPIVRQMETQKGAR